MFRTKVKVKIYFKSGKITYITLAMSSFLPTGHKLAKKCQICSIYGSSVCNYDNACRMNEEFVLDYIRGDMGLLLEILVSSKFQNL